MIDGNRLLGEKFVTFDVESPPHRTLVSLLRYQLFLSKIE